MSRALLERTVAADEAGERLDRLVARWLDEPRARTQRRLEAGRVLLDGTAVGKSTRAGAGAVVRVEADPPPAAPQPPPLVAVRYDDEHLLVVAKPPGLVVHAGAGTRGPTLVDALRAQGVPLAPATDDDASRPGIVHRLDRDTSGLLVVAKSAAARDGLVAAFRDRTPERRYWALVEGVPSPASATIDAPIARSRANRTRFAVDADGRRAVTHYDVLTTSEVIRVGRVAELAVRLGTGRTHQVRVHLASLGHPLVGDRVYGARAAVAEAVGLGRPALHAGRLAFAHPITGARVAVDEPLPPDLEVVRAGLADA